MNREGETHTVHWIGRDKYTVHWVREGETHRTLNREGETHNIHWLDSSLPMWQYDTATHCNTLQHTVLHFLPPCVAVSHCNTLCHTSSLPMLQSIHKGREGETHTVPWIGREKNTPYTEETPPSLCGSITLQHTVSHCNTQYHTATHCNTLPPSLCGSLFIWGGREKHTLYTE